MFNVDDELFKLVSSEPTKLNVYVFADDEYVDEIEDDFDDESYIWNEDANISVNTADMSIFVYGYDEDTYQDLSVLYKMFKEQVKKFIDSGINEQDFERTRKMIYGEYVKEYNDVTDISRMFLSDYFKGINSFDYLEEINTINVEYLNQVLKDVFNEKNMILSVVRN